MRDRVDTMNVLRAARLRPGSGPIVCVRAGTGQDQPRLLELYEI